MSASNRPRFWLALGAAYGFLGVICGAFGAHKLRGLLTPDLFAVYYTGVEYQFWHALALVGVGLLGRQQESRALRLAGFSFALGVPLFCGSLYALALTGLHAFGMVTPLGGVAQMIFRQPVPQKLKAFLRRVHHLEQVHIVG